MSTIQQKAVSAEFSHPVADAKVSTQQVDANADNSRNLEVIQLNDLRTMILNLAKLHCLQIWLYFIPFSKMYTLTLIMSHHPFHQEVWYKQGVT